MSATSGGCVVNTSKRSDMENVEKAEKPALHLMQGQGITAKMIAQMYKSLTGKEMTAEELAASEERISAHYANEEKVEKAKVKKSNLRI